jgi:hypothetical protein
VPTAAILHIEYRLGPSTDGLIRYIEFGPSLSSSGEMAADATSVDPRERRSAPEVRLN